MKKKTITFKLFTITALFLMFFISITMLFQSLFFQKFYISEKTERLKLNVENFQDSYDNYNYTTDEIFTAMNSFEEKNNAKIAILDKNGTIKLIRQHIRKENSSTNTEIIILAIRNWVSSLENYFDVLNTKKTLVYNFKHPNSSTGSLVLISPVIVNNNVEDIIFVVSTLQPVDEAFSIMKQYYIYIFIAAILLIAILSLIYSKMISKPLISLNNSACEISKLNFNVKCDVKSNDEIGNLASTLNFLSENLNLTLTELKSANEKLKADIEKERALEKIRKEFVAGVSHELKTPISLIEGYAEGLKDGIADENDKDYYLDVIIDESKKMNTLVCDMLDLSLLESGTFKLNTTSFNIATFINSIYKKHCNNCGDKNLILNILIKNTELMVTGDTFRLEQVLNNLISNAIRYSPEKKNIELTVKAHTESTVLIEIENEGSFIDETDINKIWDKFYRIDKSRNKNFGGVGLGLSIVKNILALHGSTYGAYNTSTGVKFYFTLTTILEGK